MSIKAIRNLVIGLIIAIVIVFGFLIFIEKVEEGKVAVVYSPSGGAQEVLPAGWHLIGLGEKTTHYPTRLQNMDNTVSVGTSDGKALSMNVRYQLKVDPKQVLTIFKELGSQDIEEIQKGYLETKLMKTVRSVVLDYSVNDVYGTELNQISIEIAEEFAKSVEDMGFIVTDVSVGTPEVDEGTKKSIDARVQAQQANELKKTELENERIEAEKKAVVAEGEAEKKIIEAEATAKAKLIDADATSEANKKIRESITAELLQKQTIERWDGKLPMVQGSDSASVIKLPEAAKE